MFPNQFSSLQRLVLLICSSLTISNAFLCVPSASSASQTRSIFASTSLSQPMIPHTKRATIYPKKNFASLKDDNEKFLEDIGFGFNIDDKSSLLKVPLKTYLVGLSAVLTVYVLNANIPAIAYDSLPDQQVIDALEPSTGSVSTSPQFGYITFEYFKELAKNPVKIPFFLLGAYVVFNSIEIFYLNIKSGIENLTNKDESLPPPPPPEGPQPGPAPSADPTEENAEESNEKKKEE